MVESTGAVIRNAVHSEVFYHSLYQGYSADSPCIRICMVVLETYSAKQHSELSFSLLSVSVVHSAPLFCLKGYNNVTRSEQLLKQRTKCQFSWRQHGSFVRPPELKPSVP